MIPAEKQENTANGKWKATSFGKTKKISQ